MAPLPDDDGRNPETSRSGRPNSATPTRHVDEQARDAVEIPTTLPEVIYSLGKQRSLYTALKAARDLLLALDENIRPPSITTDGTRSVLQRLPAAAEIDIWICRVTPLPR